MGTKQRRAKIMFGRKNSFYFFLLCTMSFSNYGMNTAIEVASHLVANADRIIDTVAAALTITDNMPHPSDHYGSARGDDSYNNRFTHDGLQLLANAHEVNMSRLGISSGDSYLNSIADKLLEYSDHQRSVVANDDVSLSTDISVNSYDAASRVVESLQEPLVYETLPAAGSADAIVEQGAVDSFKNENAFENGHAIEQVNCLLESSGTVASKKIMQTDKVLDALGDHNKQEILQKLENIFEYSKNSEIIGIQVASAIDHLKISRQLISVDTKIKLRQFFFDKHGHFHPIDSKSRQREAVNILAPSIKEYFKLYHTNKDYLDFVTLKSAQGVAGFSELRDYEIGNDDFTDYFGYGASKVASFLESEFSHKTPSMSDINNGLFIKYTAKITDLCKSGKIEEAQSYIERLSDKVNSAQKNKLSVEEYKSLKIILADAVQKAEINFQDTHQGALKAHSGRTASLKDAEGNLSNPSNNEVIADVANIIPTLPDPDKENREKNNITLEEQHANDKEYQDCAQQVSELKKEAHNEQIKDLESEEVDLIQWEKRSEKANAEYESIRNNKMDVDEIFKNTKLNKNYIQRVKDHVFYNKHKLDQGTGRFSSDLNIASAWKRFMENKFVKSDVEWFLHEFLESKLEQSFPDLPVRKIHDYVDKVHNWASMLGKGI